MKLRQVSVWVAALSIALVLAVVWRVRGATSPGDLSPAHAEDERLAGAEGCARCHDGPMAEACTACHTAIEVQLAEEKGFHGTLDSESRRGCAACHVEHHGAELELAGARAFGLAGVPDPERYDHAALDFLLEGRHAELGCEECHADARAVRLPEGGGRFLGLSQDCASCHDDPHQGRMARSCADCHGQAEPFDEIAAFEHGSAFPLVGAHGRPGCLTCHPKEGERAVEVLAGRGVAPPARDCAQCHASPHRPEFVGAVAALAEVEPGASCALCHEAVHESFASPAATASPELHAASGFALAPPHDGLECALCHAVRPDGPPGRTGGFETRFPGRSGDDCAACHADPHGGQFAASHAALGCLGCHERHAFDPPRFGAAEHALTAFPLEESHARASCEACHLVDPELPGSARRFAGTPRGCAGCHADAHGGRLARAEDCSECHRPTAFADVDRAAFDHAGRTGFALEGAHARAACETCHPPSPVPSALGRTFGRASALARGPSGECSSCHEDPHGEGFGGGLGCAGCHTSESFAPAIEDFDHRAATGFELAGAHARAECASCHPPLAVRDALGRSFARASVIATGPVERCASCHDDPHGGTFGTAGRVQGCQACHTVESFGAAREAFDHARWTGFALAGAHARAACEACHLPRQADERGRTAWPAAGSACADCHFDPHAGQFARQEDGGATDCARCHDDGEGFGAVRFDHARDTRFALDRTHARLACAACHLPWPAPGGGSVVRYKPLGTACVDCHPVPWSKGGGR